MHASPPFDRPYMRGCLSEMPSDRPPQLKRSMPFKGPIRGLFSTAERILNTEGWGNQFWPDVQYCRRHIAISHVDNNMPPAIVVLLEKCDLGNLVFTAVNVEEK